MKECIGRTSAAQRHEGGYELPETNDERSFINVFIPIHEGCGDKVILNDTQGNTQSGTQDGTQNGTQGVTQDELDNWIVEQIRKNHNITTEELAKLSKKGIRTIKRHISKLPNIRYIGRGYSGHWEVDGE